MSEQSVVTTGLLTWISQCWSMAALVFGKLAVAALILRLQSPAKWRTILLKILCIVAVVWDTVEIILIFVQCSPTEALWNPAVQGKCWNPKIVTYNGIAVACKSLRCICPYTMTVLTRWLLSLSCFYGSRARCNTRTYDLGFTNAGPAEDWFVFTAQHRCFV